MKIILISNVITPHQIPLCDALSSMSGVQLSFIETWDIDKNTLPIGWRTFDKRSYVINYDFFSKNLQVIAQMLLDADTVILGSAPTHLIINRLEQNKLTFIYSERIYKNFKQILKWPYHLYKFSRIYAPYKNLHLLCASAFSAYDYLSVGCFKDKAYKWGYFTNVDENFNVERSLEDVSTSKTVTPLMWCARFLKWKHPELPIKMAFKLKSKGFQFKLDMYGTGPELENMKQLTKALNVGDVVFFKGNLPNIDILQEMRKHAILLFTSDKNEGWGAVANESMGNGCTLVGSSAIGSVPFLLKDMENGCIYKSGDINSLTEKVQFLLQNPDQRKNMAVKGYQTMLELWSPRNAAFSLVQLINDINNGKDSSIEQGPCSKAPIIKNNWFEN